MSDDSCLLTGPGCKDIYLQAKFFHIDPSSRSSSNIPNNDLGIEIDNDSFVDTERIKEVNQSLGKEFSDALTSYREVSSLLINSSDFHKLRGSLYPPHSLNSFDPQKVQNDSILYKRNKKRELARSLCSLQELKRTYNEKKTILQKNIEELGKADIERAELKKKLSDVSMKIEITMKIKVENSGKLCVCNII